MKNEAEKVFEALGDSGRLTVLTGAGISAERGLVVPVLRSAENMPLAQMEPEIKRLAKAAREIAFVDASMGANFKRSFLSGVCGSASFTAEQEERMASSLEEMSMGIRKRYWIAATTDVDPDDPRT